MAQAARDAGHKVAFACAPSALREVRRFGLDGFVAGDEMLDEKARLERFPEMAALRPVSREWNFTRWFAGYEALARASGLLAVGQEWRPDLLVHDFAEPAGPAVAARLGIPSVASGFGIPRPDLAELIVPWVAPTWQSLGLEVPPFAGYFDHLYLDPCPPSMRPRGVEVPNSQPVRPAGGPPPRADDDEKLARLPASRTILVTFGTVFGRTTELYQTVIDAVGQLGRTVVVTLGPVIAVSELGRLPDNVFCFDFLTQGAILPRCDLVVTHGGSGSTLGPLAQGIPLLVVPQGADQFDNAAAVARAGAGLVIPPAEFNRSNLEAAARRILGEGECRAGAANLAKELAAMPEPRDVLPILERLANKDRT